MNNLIKTVVLGAVLCLGSCFGSHSPQVRQAKLEEITTVDSLGIKLGDSKTTVEKVLKSKNISYDISTSSDSPSETTIKAHIKNNIGTTVIEFTFNKDKKLISHITMCPKYFDFSNDFVKLEKQKSSYIRKASKEEKEVFLQDGNILENICLSEDGKTISLIGRREGHSMYQCSIAPQLNQ